jgi:cytidylate kinase
LKRPILTKEDILKKLVVAIDGPAGSGKSTTARLVARRLGYRHIDTGAMYRAVALKALREGADPEDGGACGALAASMQITFDDSAGGGQTVYADGVDVTDDIRTPEVTRAVSPVSAHPSVRAAMVRCQRELAEAGGAVLEGRDIGTVVLPSAEVKVYLVAAAGVRAMRRLKDLQEQGVDTTVEEVEEDLVRRDEYDSGRETSPLKRAVGSVQVDTSDLTVDGQVAQIADITQEIASHLAGLEPAPVYNNYARYRPHYRFACFVAKTCSRICFGLRINRKGNVDYKENFVFACNHKSYADPPFAGSILQREVHFIAKAGLFSNVAFAWLLRTLNAIPLRRGIFDRDAMNLVLELLRKGRSLMIFPEGSRVYRGELGKPKSGVG